MMAPRLSYGWIVWAAVVTVGKASIGDRHPVYVKCLDRCVERYCGLIYNRDKETLLLLSVQYRQDQLLLERQQRHEHNRQLESTPTDNNNKQPPRDPTTQQDNPKLDAETGAAASGGGGASQSLWEDQGGQLLFPAGAEEAGDDGGVDGGEGGPFVVDRYIHDPPRHLQVMGWDCESECGYRCMTLHVESRIRNGDRVLQYHGKWPFRRVWGIQELFASLFSAGNGLPHLYHALFSQGLYNPAGNYMRFWLTLYPWVGMNTWLWSTVFHARDVRWTEAADYFCALLNIFFAAWVAIVRVAGPPEKRRPRAREAVPWLGVGIASFYLMHIGYMWFVKFDYGYNMKVALIAGVLHTALWLRYQYLAREREYARRGAVVVILLNAAIILEVGDFPPVLYRLLDAHAIWHLVTVPLGFYWYEFLIQDAGYEASLHGRKAT